MADRENNPMKQHSRPQNKIGGEQFLKIVFYNAPHCQEGTLQNCTKLKDLSSFTIYGVPDPHCNITACKLQGAILPHKVWGTLVEFPRIKENN
jgi:hypothetical protein